MRKFLTALVLLLCPIFSLGQAATPPAGSLSQQGMAPQDVMAIFSTLSATGSTTPTSIIGNPLKPGGVNPGVVSLYTPKYITVQAFVTGTPSTCTEHIWGTLKTPVETPAFPADYQDLSGALDCTMSVNQMVHIYYKPVVGLVIQLSALAGGTSPTVTFRFLAVH